MMNNELPKIKKVTEVGEMPFIFVGKTESILQGWDATIRRTLYLFKLDTGKWGYYDKGRGEMVEVNQWNGKSAFIENHWVKMALYHRVNLHFADAINYSDWDPIAKRPMPKQTFDGLVNLTDTAYKELVAQQQGRPAGSYFKFVFTNRKIGKRMVNYIDKVLWVNMENGRK